MTPTRVFRWLLLLCAPLIASAQTISNLSTRAQVGIGSDALFAGFNITGGASKTLLIRAIGPTLGGFGVGGALADPKLTLYDATNTKLAENDNWGTPIGGAAALTTASFTSAGAFALDAGSRDAALLVTLAPGAYTAVVSGVNDTTGVALIEIYEVGASAARLSNISTRAQVGTGGNILIPGLVISAGTGTRRLLIRAAGPALGAFGVSGTLNDPAMTVTDASGAVVATNDNWGTPAGGVAFAPSTLGEVFTQSGAFSFPSGSRDASLIADFGPGNYTIQVSGVGATSGVALVEVYDVTSLPAAANATPVVTVDALAGTYRHEPYQNDYHQGVIALKPGSTTTFQWTNVAKVSWTLTPDLAHAVLVTDSTNPYQFTQQPNFYLVVQNNQLAGFIFMGQFYSRVGAAAALGVQTGGLKGYISSNIGSPPAGYGYGFSFYKAIFPLVDPHLVGFQIGLAGTWIVPDNLDFTQPLLPLGAGTIRESSPERANTYWRDVFQTIEGGSGFWTSLHFPNSTPKFHAGGTIDGYVNYFATPGWVEGRATALTHDKMGVAQLSNRLLAPPDGFTYAGKPNGDFIGVAWMALPLTPARTYGGAPIGDQSWTLFFNTTNFSGPVLFSIPDIWTRLSRTYTVIQGRGMDARPALMQAGAMEFNTVPFYQNNAADGTRYSRVPRLKFPVDAQGNTYLLQDVTAYSKAALFDNVKAWIAGGAAITGKFNASGANKPTLTANAITFHQGATGETDRTLTGYDTIVRTQIIATPGSTAFGLKWLQSGADGTLPEYYQQTGTNVMRAVTASAVPAETKLTTVSFNALANGNPYTSPASAADSWDNPAPRAGPFTTTLVDGSVVTYSWYRFADQPSLQGLGWTSADKEALQAIVEKIHTAWQNTTEFMAPPSRGTLLSLDPGMFVTPPPGLEIGYVPIVTRQEVK